MGNLVSKITNTLSKTNMTIVYLRKFKFSQSKHCLHGLMSRKKGNNTTSENGNSGAWWKLGLGFMLKPEQKKGMSTACSALLGFRNSTERHWLKQQCLHRKKKKNNASQKSNKNLDAKLRINRHTGKEKLYSCLLTWKKCWIQPDC